MNAVLTEVVVYKVGNKTLARKQEVIIWNIPVKRMLDGDPEGCIYLDQN